MKAFDLSHDVALITGGGSGLGLGMARCLSACGAKVILAGRRETVLQEAVASIRGQAAYMVHDIGQLHENLEFARRAEEAHGPISVLINNAGNHIKKVAEELSDEEFQIIIQTHLNASFSLSREFGKYMLARGRGHILFTSSIAATIGIANVAAYSAAKSAQLGLVRALATEFSPRGVRVNAITSGWVDSEMMRKALAGDPERKDKILSRTPMNCFGEAEDIGWAAVYLSSPAARFITGIALPVDGGAAIGF